jgi:membrane-bound lytic murein transglycosylase D
VIWLNEKKSSPTESLKQEVAIVQATHQADPNYFDWEIKPGEEEIKQPDKVSVIDNAKQADTEIKTTWEEEAKEGVHTVVPGETLYSISKKYNVQVTELLAWNKLDITNGIKPGQQLITVNPQPVSIKEDTPVEEPAVSNSEWVIHEVKTTDTLYSVARQYNVTIKEIMDWNKKSDFSLAMGEKLRILPK